MFGNILYVDSVATNRVSMSCKLRKAHYQAHATNSLKDIKILSDLLICDVILTDVDHASDIQCLQNLPNADKTPIIATSQKNSPSFQLSVLNAGQRKYWHNQFARNSFWHACGPLYGCGMLILDSKCEKIKTVRLGFMKQKRALNPNPELQSFLKKELNCGHLSKKLNRQATLHPNSKIRID